MAEKKDAGKPDEEEEQGGAKSSAGKSSAMKWIVIVGVAVLLLGGGAATAMYMLSAGGDDEQAEADAGDVKDTKAKKGKKDKKAKKGKGEKGEKDEAATAVAYLPLDPPFVVNLENSPQARFLQVSMEVMAKAPEAIDDVKKHMPAIRNSLLLLLSSQSYETLSTVAGKEKIRSAALADIQKILQDRTGKPGVEAVYLTAFVMQ